MYKVYFTKILFIFSILISCNNKPAENGATEWLGWYGEVEDSKAWLNLFYEGDSLLCKILESGETKTFSTELIEDPSKLDLSSLPLHLQPGIPYIKSAIKTENFYVFKVVKSSIQDFTTDYYFFVPLPQVGGPMKKMSAPVD